MPLISIENIAEDVRLGLWRMDETPEQLVRENASLAKVYAETRPLHSEKRRLERLSVHALLYRMMGDGIGIILHDASSRPLLKGYNISVSHTRGFAAVIVSHTKSVGVDIEYMSGRVNKIVDKFMRSDEMTADTVSRLINWSAKETIYKLFSTEDLQYFEMRLMPFALHDSGNVEVEDLKSAKCQSVAYRVNDDYVLTYAVR